MEPDQASADPTDVVRQLHRAVADGDTARMEALLDDDVVWHLEGDDEFAGTYEGKAAVIAALRREQAQAPIALGEVSDEEPDVVGFAFDLGAQSTMVTAPAQSDCGRKNQIGTQNVFVVNNQKVTQFGSIAGGQMSF